jgi:hypothetical protein
MTGQCPQRGAEAVPNVRQTRLASLIFHGVVERSGYRYVCPDNQLTWFRLCNSSNGLDR